MKKYLITDPQVLLSVPIIYIGLWLLSQITFSIDFLNPIARAINDFELTDIVFSLREQVEIDTNIVVVNIGDLKREGIGREIRRLNQFKPKIIGVDVLMFKPKGEEADSLLSNAIRECNGRIVMVSKLHAKNKVNDKFDSVAFSAPAFSTYAYNAFANIEEDKYSILTVRRFLPKATIQDSTYLAFGVAISKIVNPEAAQAFLARNNEEEIINFRYNRPNYYFLDTTDVLDTTPDLSFIKDKIVLMGFVDKTDRRVDDKFYTPLNKNFAGRTELDMYGIYIHANIISMILRRDYIDTMPFWLGLLISLIICYFNVVIYVYIHRNFKVFFNIFVRVFQILQSILYLALVIYIFNSYQYVLQITVIISVLLIGPEILEIYLGITNKYFLRIKLK